MPGDNLQFDHMRKYDDIDERNQKRLCAKEKAAESKRMLSVFSLIRETLR